MKSRKIYIKLTDPTGKHKTLINAHRVLDSERFIESLHKQYELDAKPDERRIVSEATIEEYLSSR